MVNRVEQRHGLTPKRLIGDTAYGVAPMLDWMVQEKGIEPHVPVWDKSDTNPNVFHRSEFRWNADEDNYQCPGGKLLKPRQRNFKKHRGKTITKAKTVIYRTSQRDCKDCALKSQCCPNTKAKKIDRSIYEDSREIARAISQTPEYRQSRNDRKKVEVLFAHLKRIMKIDRLRLRGLSGAHDEFVMAATVQNLRRLAKLRYIPPDDGIAVPA
jgi:hypothetical protein